ncbi:uncharacterized protein [Miscanthus floridulus]|uniref:uncharacterized protein isoform X2 n=1 Tax=Miscanthus floridulus TaxID=154761 RepID=UPI00345A8498
MEKFIVAAPPHSGEEPSPPPRRHRWRRITVELDGRIDARFRHRESRLLLNSFAEIGAFDHKYYMHGEERCRTYVDRMISASTIDFHPAREGVSAIEFDRKGIYLASVTLSGCLTVHDFETLYCSKYGPSCSMPDESSNYVLHISNRIPLNAVRWNPGNQDEVLHKGKSKFPTLYSESCKSLTDITFTSDDKSRIFASGLDGAVYMWDRRSSKTHCLELMASPVSQFNTVKLTVDNRAAFGATKNGTIHVWDLRGGRASAAFQSHNEVQQLLSVKLSTLLGKIASLKEQSNIVSSPILSIDFNPSCSYQLAFHLDDGWSGVLNVYNLNVTHLHCPPPAWLESTDLALQNQLRKPTWLPTSSIYAVGSSSYDGIYLLDFHPDTSSACHVDYKEETRVSEENQPAENKSVPLSQRVLSCAAHPLSHTIIAGTQFSSLLLLSQKYKTIRNPES